LRATLLGALRRGRLFILSSLSSLRILHVVPYYEDAWAYGGIPRLATTMTRGLARRGHEVTVCTTDVCDVSSRARARDRGPDVPGLQVQVFPNLSNRLAYHWQFFTPIGLSAHLRRRARQFDIAHLHACRNLPGVIAARALRRANVPYVISPNGTAPAIERRIVAKRAFDWIAGNRTLAGSARVVAVTESERRQLRQLGIADTRIAVVPNPIDEDEFTPRPDGRRFRELHELRDGPLVLFLGKLTPRKGVDVLLQAFQRLARRDATLVIAGNDMGSGDAIDSLASELQIQDRTRRIGLLKDTARLDALAAADILVYPSRDEVFGLVAAEALLCGTPVIVCDDNGCGEIVNEVGGGLCVPYGSPGKLSIVIASMLDSQDTWRGRARAAGALVLNRFGSIPVCERLEALYREVLLQHGRAA
jgi:glycosyltransferase involved in cell wall biosynthesis